MTALFDPFYGVTQTGQKFARLLNKLVMIIELLAGIGLAWAQIEYKIVGPWIYIVGPFIFVGMFSLVNHFLRTINNMVLIMVYGTSASDELLEILEKRKKKSK